MPIRKGRWLKTHWFFHILTDRFAKSVKNLGFRLLFAKARWRILGAISPRRNAYRQRFWSIKLVVFVKRVCENNEFYRSDWLSKCIWSGRTRVFQVLHLYVFPRVERTFSDWTNKVGPQFRATGAGLHVRGFQCYGWHRPSRQATLVQKSQFTNPQLLNLRMCVPHAETRIKAASATLDWGTTLLTCSIRECAFYTWKHVWMQHPQL